MSLPVNGYSSLGRLYPHILFLCFFTGVSSKEALGQTDTLKRLKEVEITSKALPTQPGMAPVQTINRYSLQQIQAFQLSDVVKHFAGVTVKDYGGIGGLKTVSVRGLGANHTGFCYDGITITDNQTGQIDLGKFSVNNVDQISLTIGNPESILNTARSFSSASLLTVNTTAPVFTSGENMAMNGLLKVGSFGLISPSITIHNKLSDKVSNSFLSEFQNANGKYPFVLHYGGSGSKDDSVSSEKRSNTDIVTLRLEENFFITLNEKEKLSSKIYYFQSERGLPGATILYNTHSSERLWDKTFFVQSKYEKSFSAKIEALFNVKYAKSYLRYLNPDYLGVIVDVQDNNYHQNEVYGSAAAVYKASNEFQVGLSSDVFYNSMDADLHQFAYPSRFTWLTALNSKWTSNRFNIQLGVLSSAVYEAVKQGDTPKNHFRFSPSVLVSYQPFANNKLSFRFFYKDIFRMPTFNDLFYTQIGNTKLKPENAHQFNLGLSYNYFTATDGSYLSSSLDAYHNKVRDKIVAKPTKNLFIWTMRNIGLVYINGIDLSVKAGKKIGNSVFAAIEGTYTFQQVLDMTNPEEKTYGDQLAYTPKHSGSAIFSLSTPPVDLAYNLLFAGSRYILNENIPQNYLSAYSEHGLTLSKAFKVYKLKNKLSLEVLNILNTQYEVVRNFPMPGRSLRVSYSLKF
ncbi:TonB-dependent receptor plug domain-containing protein [Solitalea lacus]|uniref:TonB-dependent receptor plug domain-containing protein n=1 Tax=Solitalea lacus TaxID=2911172 RepID=UPI001EDA5FE9|nr:TonB-dependent receptor [Solitalea lacus]UKJ08315.1 TonB-dependent receptor [Solitalea lacus]